MPDGVSSQTKDGVVRVPLRGARNSSKPGRSKTALRGRLSGFSAERLFAVLNRLGHSVEVRFQPKRVRRVKLARESCSPKSQMRNRHQEPPFL